MKKFREETAFLLRRMGWLMGAAFAFGFLGTLVWINGRGAWFVMRFADFPRFAPSLSLAYTLWLIAYGMLGASFLLSVLCGVRRRERCLVNAGLVLLSYLMSLLWHAFFYSAWFVVPALLALLCAAAAEVVFLLRMAVKSIWFLPFAMVILGIQLYFIVFTVACF